MAWPLVKALFGTESKVMCETCNDWIPLDRDAKIGEIVGIDIPEQGELPEEPPF